MPTATMGVSSVDRLARSKRPTVERTEIHIPPAPVFPVEAVTGDPRMRAQAVAAFNNALQKWRNDAWSIEAPFVPDAELQADVATLEDTMAKLVTKLDRAAVDIRRAEANITTISTNVTNIDNSITTIDNRITIVESNSITGTGIVQANGTNPPTAILGSTGHFPYWQPTDPHLSATSPIYLSAGFIGIGTVGPATELDVVGVVNASTGFRVNNLAVAGTVLRSNGTNYIGGQVVLTTDVTGLLPTVSGGTNHGNYTAGSVIFAGAGGTSLTEDNANLFWDDANNRLGVGTAVPVTELSVVSTSASDPRGIMSAQYSTDAVGARLHFRKARGTEALPTTVVTGDVLGRIRFSGYDGANYLQMGSIDAVTFGTVAATRVPVDLVFSTAADVAPSVLTERMRIKGAGGVQIPRDTSFQSLTAGSAIVILATYTSASGENTLGSLTNANKTHIGFSGGLTVLGTGSVGIGVSSPSNRLHLHINDAVTTVTDVLRINHANTAGTSANFGTGIIITGKSSTTDNQHMARIQTIWTDATDATRTSALQFQTVNSAAALATRMSLSGVGGLSVGDGTTTTAVGVINAVTGYRVASAAATSGTYLRGNGTNFIGSALLPGDFAYAFTEGSVIFAGVGGTSLAEDNANLFWNNAANALGIGINTFAINERLHVYNADALTASNGLVLIENDATSATVAVNKYGLIVESNGNWTGAGSTVYGISSRANDGTGGSTQVAGVFGWAEGGSALVKGIYGLAGATVAGVTSSIGVHGVSSNSVAPTNAYGGLFSAAGGTDNYSICCVAGKIKNDTVESLICSNAALATNATFGFLYIPTCAGAPTGVPVTETGTCAHLFNTTSNKLGIYDGKWFQFSPYEVKSYDVADTGNVGIGEDTLRTYTIPGGTMSDNGDSIEFYAAGTFATSINSKRLRVKFGATTIFDSGALAITSTADWCLDGSIIRTGATTQRAVVTLTTSSGTLSAYCDYTTAGETLSGNVNLDITGEATSNDDIVCTLAKTMYLGTA